MKIKKRLITQSIELWRSMWSWLPGGLGATVRRLAYTPCFFKVGKDFRCGSFVCIQGFSNISLASKVCLNRYSSLYASRGKISIGDRFFLGDFSSINANEAQVSIGKNVAIGPMSLIQGANHKFDDVSRDIIDQGHEYNTVSIEDNVWIGAHCVILPGVHIASGAVIAAGSIVTKDVAKNSVVAGAPARPIRQRGN